MATADVSPAGRRWALPLLLCSEEGQDEEGTHPLDRIRVQKGIFLMVQRGSDSWRDLYDFRPYDWGPYCRDLAADLHMLIANNLLRVAGVPESRYGKYVLTSDGQRLAEMFWGHLDLGERRFIAAVRSYVTNKDFNGLLREVYDAFPAYASQSRWPGRR